MRKIIAIFHPQTDAIRHIVKCHERDIAGNVALHADHQHLDITDHPQAEIVKPGTHAVHRKELTIILREPTLEEARFAKEREIGQAWERAMKRAILADDFDGARAAARAKRRDLEAEISAAHDVAALAKITWGD